MVAFVVVGEYPTKTNSISDHADFINSILRTKTHGFRTGLKNVPVNTRGSIKLRFMSITSYKVSFNVIFYYETSFR